MRQFLNNVMLVVALVMLAVGVLFLVYGYYAVWFTRHESTPWRAILSFIYLIPGWALTVMGYFGWGIEGLRATRQSSQDRESV